MFIGFILSLYSILLVAGCAGPMTEAPTAPQTFGGNNAPPVQESDQRNILSN